MEFSYSQQAVDDTSVQIKLKGYFDELAHLPNDLDLSTIKILYIDFAQVEFINSGGIKLWVNFTRKLQENPSIKVYFQKCKRMIIDQINLVEGFLPSNAKVTSLYVPIFCNRCERSFHVFQKVDDINMEDLDNVINEVDAPNCDFFPKCKQDLEVDMVPDHFFRFLNRSQK